jgi:hypothetical protein
MLKKFISRSSISFSSYSRVLLCCESHESWCWMGAMKLGWNFFLTFDIDLR